MELPIGVLEPIDRRHRSTKFALLGVPVSFTRWAWLSYPIMMATALPLAWLEKRNEGAVTVALRAWQLGAIFMMANNLHSLGHILAGKIAGAPMDELIVTSTRQVNHYQGDQSHHPTSTHVTRAMGGMAMNLLIAVIFFVLYHGLGKKISPLRDIALVNGATALSSMMPVESVDGGSILEQLRKG
jgi:hypothetical protein